MNVPDTVTMDKNGKIETRGEINVGYVVSQQELSKNDHLLFNADFITSLYNSKNEDEIKKTFENSGIKNSEVILNLLKNQLNEK